MQRYSPVRGARRLVGAQPPWRARVDSLYESKDFVDKLNCVSDYVRLRPCRRAWNAVETVKRISTGVKCNGADRTPVTVDVHRGPGVKPVVVILYICVHT